MKKNFLLSLVLVASFAQSAFGMDENRDQNPNVPENKELANKTFSVNTVMNTLSSKITLGFNYLKKITDPFDYATSDKNVKLVKFATFKFRAVETIEDYQNLQNFKSAENDPVQISGNLVKKVGDRNTALYNVIGGFLIRKNSEEYKQLNELAKQLFNVEFKHITTLKSEVYEPAMESIDNALKRLVEKENANEEEEK